MSGADNGLSIHDAVYRGVSEWDTTAQDMNRSYSRLMARIVELNAAAPWGDGAEGLAFRESYMQGGGPNVLLSNGSHVVQQIIEAGPRLLRTFDNSFGTDAAHAQDLAQGTARPT
ncbi:hypothetical protein AB0395_17275 [Streptosporangium sp. NPDC051023]|uniref:hypothetical protein n=1 Tax=Streptosporangium sp. NPDC051023 TaxID=3155410 RepID=UPI00344BEC78